MSFRVGFNELLFGSDRIIILKIITALNQNYFWAIFDRWYTCMNTRYNIRYIIYLDIAINYSLWYFGNAIEKWGISKKKHLTSLKMKNKPKIKVFDFGAFQIKMHMASRGKYIFHMLFGVFHTRGSQVWSTTSSITWQHMHAVTSLVHWLFLRNFWSHDQFSSNTQVWSIFKLFEYASLVHFEQKKWTKPANSNSLWSRGIKSARIHRFGPFFLWRR